MSMLGCSLCIFFDESWMPSKKAMSMSMLMLMGVRAAVAHLA
jgi:hypothetical protein